jgi:predicted RNA binding protein with dsRBD fold (UPF0201 family)
MDTKDELAAVRAELAGLKEQLRRQAIELAEARAFLRESISELSQQVKEAKAAALMREGGVPTAPRLLPQR